MNRYDMVVFDLDGTILNTGEGILASVKHTIRTLKLPMLDDEALSTFIGPPIQDSFARAYGLSGDVLQVIATLFRDHYKDIDLLKASPYEGIYDAFEGMVQRGIRPAVATYKREDYALTLLKHYHFDRYTDIMHGGDHENKLKKKDIINLCIQEAGITDKSRVVMVGDTIHDAVGAEQMGVDFIGVTFGFGFHTAKDLEGIPNVGCAERAIDLLKLV